MNAQSLTLWQRSTFSSSGADCVELSYPGAIRDSKNTDGSEIHVDLTALVAAVKGDQLTR